MVKAIRALHYEVRDPIGNRTTVTGADTAFLVSKVICRKDGPMYTVSAGSGGHAAPSRQREGSRPVRRPTGSTPDTAGRASAATGPGLAPRDVLALQRSAGNRAVGALVGSAPFRPVSSRPAPPQPTLAMVVQRVEDPEQQTELCQFLKDKVHQAVYKRYKDLSSVPKPSDRRLNQAIEKIAGEAADSKHAYELYARMVVDQYFHGDDAFKGKLVEEISALAAGAESGASAEKRARDSELASLREQLGARPAKRPRLGAAQGEIPTYTKEQREELSRRLAMPAMRGRLFDASRKGYERHRAAARPAIEGHARLGNLSEAQPLSTHDMALAQSSYQHGRMGDSLLLEGTPPGTPGYRVTMSRGGGQEIQQLGPYLGGKKSVQQIINEILDTKTLTSGELAAAIDIRDGQQVAAFLERRKAPDWVLGKIRAMRHLRAVEMDRGPEVASATALQHRSAVHLYTHMAQYPEKTPLGPAGATANLAEARRRHETTPQPEPHDYTYIPEKLQDHALASITSTLTAYVEDPKLDPELQKLVGAVLAEAEAPGAASDMLVDATTDILRTPQHPGLEDDVAEVVDAGGEAAAGAPAPAARLAGVSAPDVAPAPDTPDPSVAKPKG